MIAVPQTKKGVELCNEYNVWADTCSSIYLPFHLFFFLPLLSFLNSFIYFFLFLASIDFFFSFFLIPPATHMYSLPTRPKEVHFNACLVNALGGTSRKKCKETSGTNHWRGTRGAQRCIPKKNLLHFPPFLTFSCFRLLTGVSLFPLSYYLSYLITSYVICLQIADKET